MSEMATKQRKITVDGISADAPIKVLYIAGYGRSGSTILDTVLGNHPEIESVGEASHIVQQAWVTPGFCACGVPGDDCDFWNEVRTRWLKRAHKSRPGFDMRHYSQLIREIEPRVLWLPKLARRVSNDPQVIEYAELTAQLMAAIRDASGASVVVDSSKQASRALVLSMVEGVDLRLVHLVRDCRGVAWSGKKRFQKDEQSGVQKDDRGKRVMRTTATWTAINLASSWLRRYLPNDRSIRVRYEDFITQPQVELERIGRLMELDLRPLGTAVAAGQSMDVGHTIAGNRLRMAGSLKLKPDLEWLEKLTATERAKCWALSGWLMKAYGYRMRPQMLNAPIEQRPAA